MNALFIGMKNVSKDLAMYLLYATGLLCLLFYVGNFNGGFLSVMGNLFLMIVEIALWILIPILLAAGKRDTAKGALRPIFSFWLIYSVFTFFTDCTQIGGFALVDALAAFEFLVACAFVVMAVLTVLSFVRKDARLKKIAFLIFTGCLVFYLVVFSLRIAVYARFGAGWNDYFEAIYKFLSLPFGMYFLVQHFEFTLDDMIIFEAKPAARSKPETAPAEAEENEGSDSETSADPSEDEAK